MTLEALYQIYLQHPKVQTDTRKLQAGDLYFALKGDNFNGNHFTSEAFNKGAVYCIIDEPAYALNEQCIVVENVLSTLQALSRHHRQQFTIPFLAITGSNGKTTTKELIHAVMASSFNTVATKGNLNNHIGVPLTLLSIHPNTEFAIIEMGANHQQEIASYCTIALPTFGLINNCGKAHLEGFGGVEGVRKGKGELYDFIRNHEGVIFRNADVDYLNEMAKGIEKQITYGEFEGDYRGKIISTPQETTLQVAILNSGKECIIKSHLVGTYNFPNIMAAVAVGSYFGIPIDKIKQAIEGYVPDNSRSQLIQQGSTHIILDAYNANPSSMQVAIQNFISMPYGKKFVMLGGMKELGNDSIVEHQRVVAQLEESAFDQVVLVGGDFQHTHGHFHYFENTQQARDWYREQNKDNTAILIKGSRAFAMETILD